MRYKNKKNKRRKLIKRIFTFRRILMVILVFAASLFSYYTSNNLKDSKQIIIYLNEMGQKKENSYSSRLNNFCGLKVDKLMITEVTVK
ncbi:hypothetical protein ACER0A_011370 [Haloimpatiens sp. FM7315]|uniref:hypothetical protein n=1 Tax=Haloimpatiens sp. FM7315 TaxID=3298609 RepID=UPI0035A384C8